MRLFAIGDLHLSLGETVNKPMDIFGPKWENHAEKLKDHFHKNIRKDDVVILCGDLSWGLKMEEAKTDLDWINELPGRKLLFKGNHDLWWQSTQKLNRLYEEKPMFFIQNNSWIGDFGERGRIAVAGTRGWICPGAEDFGEHDKKIYEREILRLKMSLDSAKAMAVDEIVGVLHFPPTNDKKQVSGFTRLMEEYGVKTCVYGHLHGKEAFKNGFQGLLNGVRYRLVSLDYVDACPVRIL